jgi:hypothetical protein
VLPGERLRIEASRRGQCGGTDISTGEKTIYDGKTNLMGNTDDNKGCVLDDIPQMCGCYQIPWKFDIREIPLVLMSPVDDICQFLSLNLCILALPIFSKCRYVRASA